MAVSVTLACRSLFFGDYMSASSDSRVYDEIKDFDQLTATMKG